MPSLLAHLDMRVTEVGTMKTSTICGLALFVVGIVIWWMSGWKNGGLALGISIVFLASEVLVERLNRAGYYTMGSIPVLNKRPHLIGGIGLLMVVVAAPAGILGAGSGFPFFQMLFAAVFGFSGFLMASAAAPILNDTSSEAE